MTGQPDERATPSEPDRQEAVRHADVALRSMGQPNSVTGEFDFWDNSYEGRRLFSELLGTFFLVLVAVGGGMVNARFGGDAVPSGAAVVAPALMVAAIILFMGTVSGAHLNPAVSVAFALRGDFPWKRVPAYIVAQLIGAVLATLLLWALIGKQGSAGLTLPGAGISTTTAMLWELVLTTGLVSVILGTASGAQQIGPLAAIGVGGYIALAGLWGAPVSGASMNPARSLGPALVLGRLDVVVGVSGRAGGGRGDRGGHRLRPAGSRRRPQRGGRGAGHARRGSAPRAAGRVPEPVDATGVCLRPVTILGIRTRNERSGHGGEECRCRAGVRSGPWRGPGRRQLSRADRVARGKDARAVAPLESHARVRAGPVAGSGRAAAGAGQEPGAGAGADPARADAGVAVHVLPGRGAADGGRPGRHADLGAAGAAVRGCAPVQFRRVRLAGAAAGLRRQRLRRDAARAVRVGRQAAGGEPGRGRAGQRVPGQGPPQDRPRGGRGLPDGDARRSRSSRCWTVWYAHLDIETDHRPVPVADQGEEGQGQPRRCWPRRTPGTACRRWASSPPWSTGSGGSSATRR